MTAMTDIRAADVNLSAIMEREGIYQVRRYLQGRISVTLDDGRIGVGSTEAEALAKARQPDAENVRKVAA